MSVADVSLCLKKLLEESHFNVETLAKYLSLSVESVYQIAQGKQASSSGWFYGTNKSFR